MVIGERYDTATHDTASGVRSSSNDESEFKNSQSMTSNLHVADQYTTSVGPISSNKLVLHYDHDDVEGREPEHLQTISSSLSEKIRRISMDLLERKRHISEELLEKKRRISSDLLEMKRHISSEFTEKKRRIGITHDKPLVMFIDEQGLVQNGTESSDLSQEERPTSSELPEKKRRIGISSERAFEVLMDGKPHKMDAGWAWLVLFACTLLHMLSDGVIQSMGVFLVVWQEQFPDNTISELSFIPSLIFTCAYVAGPFGSALCKTFSIRQVVMGGTIITSGSFVMAAFSTSLWQLYAAFSIAGIGIALALQPTTFIITYYFEKLLARANGVSYAGVGLGVFAFPSLSQIWIDGYGWQGALLIIAGLVANMGICAAIYRSTPLEEKSKKRGRIFSASDADELENTTCTRSDIEDSLLYNFIMNFLKSFDIKLLKNVHFALMLIAQCFYATGFAISIIYLPARAVQAGIQPLPAAFLVSIIGISSFVSRITHGYIIDWHIMTAPVFTALAFLVCGITCALYPIADEYAGLIVLSAIFGLTSGVYNSTVPLMAKDYVGLHKVSGAVGLIHLVVGVGVTLGSYGGGFLVDATGGYDMPFYLAGACFIISSILVFIYPISKCLERRDEVDDDTGIGAQHTVQAQGHDNLAMETD